MRICAGGSGGCGCVCGMKLSVFAGTLLKDCVFSSFCGEICSCVVPAAVKFKFCLYSS